MGMGEPLANYRRVVAASAASPTPRRTVSGISQRNVVVSTVGSCRRSRKLTEEGLQVTLALSLHAPDDELRDTLVPVNTRWPVREVLAAALGYTRQTGRRGVHRVRDDQGSQRPARSAPTCWGGCCAASWCTSTSSRSTPPPASEWDASPKPVEREFVRRLRAAGVATTVRDTRGQEIAGACGQLAAVEV